MDKKAIGIDIGGTKISISIGNASGKILFRSVIPTLTKGKTPQGFKLLLDTLEALIKKSTLSRNELLGIGAVMPGPVNSISGLMPPSPHLNGWEGLPIQKELKKKFKLPVYLANDANSAAVAEKVFGGAKDSDHFIYLTVSTGVGGGVFANGKLLEGVSFVGGEIGHMTVVVDGDPWVTGRRGSLESYSSGTAIANYVSKEIESGKGSAKLKKLLADDQLTTKNISKLAQAGDSLSKKAFQRSAKYLGVGMGNLLNILNPDKILIGGGVMKSAPSFFLKEAIQSCKNHSWPQAFNACSITKSKITSKVGDLGALSIVFLNQGQKH